MPNGAHVAMVGDLDLTTPLDLGTAESLLDEHGASHLNPTQLRVLNAIGERLSQRVVGN